jgi:hypothetical protein
MTLAREGTYDVVVGNPPYQGLSKTTQFDYVVKAYPRGKADLYAAFLERGLELVREGGVSAMVTMQGWMFLSQFTELRRWMLEDNSVRTIADMMWCAFESMRHATVAMNVTMRGRQAGDLSVAIAPTPRDEREESMPALARKRAAVLAQVGRHEFDPKGFAVIDGEPIVYWWSKEFLERYAAAPKLGEDHKALNGLSTQNNVRFIRTPTEIRNGQLFLSRSKGRPGNKKWCPYIKGGEGAEWFEPLSWTVAWGEHSGELRVFLDEYQKAKPGGFIKHEGRYFGLGVAFSVIGAGFSARAHRWSSIFGHMGSSIFPEDVPTYLTVMNSRTSREVLQSLNPSVHFLASDVDRLPVFRIANADTIFSTLESAFTEHESHREPSVEFRSPGPSPWRHAQDWAQRSVDRPEGAPLPPYEPQLDPPAPEAAVTFAIGVALGRFGAKGEGILDQAPADALPAGILFVGPHDATEDSLRHPACAPIHAAWAEGQLAITGGTRVSLRDWLRKDLFAHHKGLYENRPIYFPLSSKKKSFVAWVSIHRWADNTLSTLLADHLSPTLRSLDLELTGLNEARATLDKKARAAADKRYDAVKPQRDELAEMIELVKELSQRGAPPTDAECPPRKADAPFVMDLDDGVMINSAALWPLLAPQWADPKKWWKQLCRAENKKDYAWAHLAKRYFPARVDDKCKTDPSLAVAHGCFWRYHPAKAYAWELRLQDEIKPGFTIDEPGSDEARAAFERAHPAEVEAIREKERRRREQRARQAAEGDAEAAGDADGGDADGEDEEAEA